MGLTLDFIVRQVKYNYKVDVCNIEVKVGIWVVLVLMVLWVWQSMLYGVYCVWCGAIFKNGFLNWCLNYLIPDNTLSSSHVRTMRIVPRPIHLTLHTNDTLPQTLSRLLHLPQMWRTLIQQWWLRSYPLHRLQPQRLLQKYVLWLQLWQPHLPISPPQNGFY